MTTNTLFCFLTAMIHFATTILLQRAIFNSNLIQICWYKRQKGLKTDSNEKI